MHYKLTKQLKDAGFPQEFSLEEILIFATANEFLKDTSKTAMEIYLFEYLALKSVV